MSDPSSPSSTSAASVVSGVGERAEASRSRRSQALTEADVSLLDEEPLASAPRVEETLEEPRASWAPGALLAGKYTLLRPLGIGGMGVVWCARNEATGADVAIKMVLPRTLADRDELAQRFRQEARATARLRHRSIVCVYDLVEVPEDGNCSLALVMELLEGETLAKLLERRSFLAPHEAAEIALALLAALAHAHEAGIVHRDLKPENVFLATDGEGAVTPKILDFGISKLDLPKLAGTITRDGELLGTPSYMSPEQARSSDVDGRSDLFNVGILLYEMLTGFNPFAGEGLHAVIVAILEHDPAPLAAHGVSRELAAVVDRALAKDPKDRFASAREMNAALRAAIGDTRQGSSPRLNVATLGQVLPQPQLALAHLSTVPAPEPGSVGGVSSPVLSGPRQRMVSFGWPRHRRTGLALLAGTAVLAACALGFSAPRRMAGATASAAGGDVVGSSPAPSLNAAESVARVTTTLPAHDARDAGAAAASSDAVSDSKAGATGKSASSANARGGVSPAPSGSDPSVRPARAVGRGGFVRDPGF